VTIANQAQAEHWNSSEQASRWVDEQDLRDRMLAPFAAMIFSAAALSPGEHVLDVGCGCGTTTLDAARAVAPGRAVGVDLSAPMLERARQNATRFAVTNVSFEQGDAQTYTFPIPERFDVVISRFGVMFFADPVAAFANLRTAARPDGRLTFVCWQPLAANEWLTVTAGALAEHLEIPDQGDPSAPGMFALAEPDRVRSILTDSGWHSVCVTPERVPMLMGGGTIEDAVTFLRTGWLGRSVLDGAEAGAQARAIDALRAALTRRARGDEVHLETAVWLVQAKA
jgi:SAM-dependent methyltransferase